MWSLSVSVSPSIALHLIFVSLFCFFKPHFLIEQLSRAKQAVTEEDLREKQLGALRVDVCSTEALKRLKGQTFESVSVITLSSDTNRKKNRSFVLLFREQILLFYF